MSQAKVSVQAFYPSLLHDKVLPDVLSPQGQGPEMGTRGGGPVKEDVSRYIPGTGSLKTLEQAGASRLEP